MQANGVTVSGMLLAAGSARRMGETGHHKLLAEFDGIPLVRRLAMRLLAADFACATVVIGDRRHDVEAALSGLPIDICFNAGFSTGISSSLIAAMQIPNVRRADGILVMLADMPGIETTHLNRLIDAFRLAQANVVVRATGDGEFGNPVILPRPIYGAVLGLNGDEGARKVIGSSGLDVVGVEIGSAAHLDVDTPDAVLAAGGVLR